VCMLVLLVLVVLGSVGITVRCVEYV